MLNLAPLRVVLLQQQTADETTSLPIDVTGYTSLTFYLIGYGTLDSGVITYEESTDDPETEQVYGGTWSAITTQNANDVTGGAQQAYHATVGAYHRVRARISTVIAGTDESISVVLVAVP